MSNQIAVRLPDALTIALDEAVAEGFASSRAEAVRAALQAWIEGQRRVATGRAIATAYLTTPQDDELLAAATAAALASIAEEPW